MTADLLPQILGANLIAACAVGVVLILRGPIRRLFGARLAYGLWALVPLAVAASLLPPLTLTPRSVLAPSLRPLAQTAIESFEAWTIPTASAVATPRVSLALILLAIWGAGFAAALFLTIRAQRQAMRRLGGRAAGPALVGFIRPRLVLPADFEARFSPREQALVLAHEHTHLARGHTRVNGLIAAARAIAWFNPMVHVGGFYARVDQELACDAQVVERYPAERRAYAEAMLKTQVTATPLPLGCYWPGRSSKLLMERVAMLASDPPGRARFAAGAMLVGALTVGGALSAWAAQADKVAAPAATSARAAVGAVLGGAPQGKVVAPAAAAAVKPGSGAGAAAAGDTPAVPAGLSSTDSWSDFTEAAGFRKRPDLTLEKIRQGKIVHMEGTLVLPDGRVVDFNMSIPGDAPQTSVGYGWGGRSALQLIIDDDGRIRLRTALDSGGGRLMLGDPLVVPSGGRGSVTYADGSVLNVALAEVREPTPAQLERAVNLASWINIREDGTMGGSPPRGYFAPPGGQPAPVATPAPAN